MFADLSPLALYRADPRKLDLRARRYLEPLARRPLLDALGQRVQGELFGPGRPAEGGVRCVLHAVARAHGIGGAALGEWHENFLAGALPQIDGELFRCGPDAVRGAVHWLHYLVHRPRASAPLQALRAAWRRGRRLLHYSAALCELTAAEPAWRAAIAYDGGIEPVWGYPDEEPMEAAYRWLRAELFFALTGAIRVFRSARRTEVTLLDLDRRVFDADGREIAVERRAHDYGEFTGTPAVFTVLHDDLPASIFADFARRRLRARRQAGRPWAGIINERELVDQFEPVIRDDPVYALLRPWIARQLTAGQAIDGELVELAARAFCGGGPAGRADVSHEAYATVWRAEPAFRSAGDLCARVLETLGQLASTRLLPAQATLAEARAALRVRGLRDAGWKWIVTHGTADLESACRDDPEENLGWMVALANAFARSRIAPPVGGFVRLLVDASNGWPILADDEPPAWLMRALYEGWKAGDIDADDRQSTAAIVSWALQHRPRLDANQRRAGWPAVYRAYCDHPDGLRQTLEPVCWPVPFRERTVGGLRVICLGNAWELWQEGEAMNHCIASYTETCKAGRFLAFSIREADGRRRATFTLTRDEVGQPWRMDDVRGPANRDVHEELRAIAEAEGASLACTHAAAGR